MLAAGLLPGCSVAPRPWDQLKLQINWAGQDTGHAIRDRLRRGKLESFDSLPKQRCQIAVVGSGAGALSSAYFLRERGAKSIVLLEGPERFGNAAALNHSVPTGAHYLPLPSTDLLHVRQILRDMGVLSGPVNASKPVYQEEALVHAPVDRLWINGNWQQGLVPALNLTDQERKQQESFFEFTQKIRQQSGSDGKRLFTIPAILSSEDPTWTALDHVTFSAWLDEKGYKSSPLRWYLNYCCRDEYGAGIEHVSAWAGLHYFCARDGHAEHVEDGAVLTWSDGLATLNRFMWAKTFGSTQPLEMSTTHKGFSPLPDSALRITDKGRQVEVTCLDSKTGRLYGLLADQVVVATPLFVAAQIVPEIQTSFRQFRQLLPEAYPWLIGNFQFQNRLPEFDDEPIAWDSVVYGSSALGLIHSTHQQIRVDQHFAPRFTSYAALDQMDGATSKASAVRQMLAGKTPSQLLNIASQDLTAIYGLRVWRHIAHAHITVRGHGMACPTPGFLRNPLLQALRNERGRIQYAHSDLSGYSIFEEATWWGSQIRSLA